MVSSMISTHVFLIDRVYKPHFKQSIDSKRTEKVHSLQSYVAGYIDNHLSPKCDTFEKLLLELLTMRFEAVLLLFFATAMVLECCCASPAAFGNTEIQTAVDRVRRTRHTGTGTQEEEEEESPETSPEESPETSPEESRESSRGGRSAVLIVLREISNFLNRAGNAGTNCVTQSCFPFDAGQCLTCLALVGLAAVGK